MASPMAPTTERTMLRAVLRSLALLLATALLIGLALVWVASRKGYSARREPTAHFTASAFVVDAAGSRTCLVEHVKLGRLLQPGGHIEDDDASVEDAALREAREETALDVALHPEAPRTARFVCAAVIVADGEVAFEATGVVDGVVAHTAAGTHGFGYDPIFFYPPYNATFGEVSRQAKLRVSHRGNAFRQVAAWLRNPV